MTGLSIFKFSEKMKVDEQQPVPGSGLGAGKPYCMIQFKTHMFPDAFFIVFLINLQQTANCHTLDLGLWK